MTIKSQSKTGPIKNKKSKISKSTYSISAEDVKIISNLEKELIKDLYKFASEGKSKAEITLTELDYPETYKTKVKLLDKLKREEVIKKYALLKPEKVVFQPSEPRKPSKLEMEVSPEVLLQQIPDDYDETYLLNASIEFDSKKVIKLYQKIYQKEIIEEDFKNEVVLQCGELKFGLETGNAIYKNTITNFKPNSKEYNLLKEFLEHPNRRRSTERLTAVLFSDKKEYWKWKNYQKKVKWFVDKLRKKLEMYGKKPINEDLFEPCNGYRIKCKKK